MNRFFLSEDQKAFGVIAHQTATANTAIVSSALDKTNLAKDANSQGGLAFVIKKTSTGSKITEVIVTTCETSNGTFAEVAFQDSNVSIFKEKLANMDQTELFLMLGIKQDVLKKYFKFSVKTDTAEAVEVIGLVAKTYGE